MVSYPTGHPVESRGHPIEILQDNILDHFYHCLMFLLLIFGLFTAFPPLEDLLCCNFRDFWFGIDDDHGSWLITDLDPDGVNGLIGFNWILNASIVSLSLSLLLEVRWKYACADCWYVYVLLFCIDCSFYVLKKIHIPLYCEHFFPISLHSGRGVLKHPGPPVKSSNLTLFIMCPYNI